MVVRFDQMWALLITLADPHACIAQNARMPCTLCTCVCVRLFSCHADGGVLAQAAPPVVGSCPAPKCT